MELEMPQTHAKNRICTVGRQAGSEQQASHPSIHPFTPHPSSSHPIHHIPFHPIPSIRNGGKGKRQAQGRRQQQRPRASNGPEAFATLPSMHLHRQTSQTSRTDFLKSSSWSSFTRGGTAQRNTKTKSRDFRQGQIPPPPHTHRQAE